MTFAGWSVSVTPLPFMKVQSVCTVRVTLAGTVCMKWLRNSMVVLSRVVTIYFLELSASVILSAED